MKSKFQFTLNGKPERVSAESRRTLLEVLREDLDLTGTKYGCGEGQCRACTVLLDGKAVRSCQTEISEVEGRAVKTIEGLALNGNLCRCCGYVNVLKAVERAAQPRKEAQ